MDAEKVKKMHEAVDLAKGHGLCKYRDDDGKPLCVAAQYVAMCYPDVLPKLVEGKNIDPDDGPFSVERGAARQGVAVAPIPNEERNVLRLLQLAWDDGFTTVEEARKRMHKYIKDMTDAS